MPKPTVPLDVQTLRTLLAHSRFADIRYRSTTASTNADAQALLGASDALGTTLVAEYQTAGTGRKGRRWFAPPGAALLFTTLLPLPVATQALWAVPFWISLAVAHAVENTCGVALELVWPNDLYLRGGKTGGILSVARITGDDAWVGCGVGLNVFAPEADAELDALEPQPAFLDRCCADPEREAILVAILQDFDASLDELAHPQRIAARWEKRAQLCGTVYRYRRDADGIERDGVAQRLGAQGSLVVRDAEREVSIDMADVRVIGRAPALTSAAVSPLRQVRRRTHKVKPDRRV